jgi:hypothetical protein
MEDEPFTTDQLLSLQEFLPTEEERNILLNYKGDQDWLGPVSN